MFCLLFQFAKFGSQVLAITVICANGVCWVISVY